MFFLEEVSLNGVLNHTKILPQFFKKILSIKKRPAFFFSPLHHPLPSLPLFITSKLFFFVKGTSSSSSSSRIQNGMPSSSSSQDLQIELKMVDCHAHLTSSELSGRMDELLRDAAICGVKDIVVVSEDVPDADSVLSLCRTQNGIADNPVHLHPCIGLHPESVPSDPHEAEEMTDTILRILADAEAQGDVVGVGECGLDFTAHVAASREVQTRAFERQIEAAVRLGLPVNVHSRMAGHYAIESLVKCGVGVGGVGALLHAFDGKVSYAVAGTQKNCFFSVPPCFVNSASGLKLISKLPDTALCLETDAPALSHRKGEVNVPANIAVSLQCVAEVKGAKVHEMAPILRENSLNLFGKLR